jgi:hypothetical protein
VREVDLALGGGYCEADWIAKARERRRRDGEGDCDEGILRSCWNGDFLGFFYILLMENEMKELLELL